MQKQIYMVIGCPGSGKSWVCNQLRGRYHYVSHDDYLDMSYLDAIVRESATAKKPLLVEVPFSISQLKDPLEKKGYSVTPVFIQEDHGVIRERYRAREGRDVLEGHLSRQKTYTERAALWHSFAGTSEQVLAYLKNAVPWKQMPWERSKLRTQSRNRSDTMNDELRMDAYYYGFTPTGVPAIDKILSAVACAGKSFHHTQDWNDESEWEPHKGKTPAEWIQNAANEAASAFANGDGR